MINLKKISNFKILFKIKKKKKKYIFLNIKKLISFFCQQLMITFIFNRDALYILERMIHPESVP